MIRFKVTARKTANQTARLQRFNIEAPFSGTVGLRSASVGDYVRDDVRKQYSAEARFSSDFSDRIKSIRHPLRTNLDIAPDIAAALAPR